MISWGPVPVGQEKWSFPAPHRSRYSGNNWGFNARCDIFGFGPCGAEKMIISCPTGICLVPSSIAGFAKPINTPNIEHLGRAETLPNQLEFESHYPIEGKIVPQNPGLKLWLAGFPAYVFCTPSDWPFFVAIKIPPPPRKNKYFTSSDPHHDISKQSR